MTVSRTFCKTISYKRSNSTTSIVNYHLIFDMRVGDL